MLVFDLDLDLGTDLDFGYFFGVVLMLSYYYKPLKVNFDQMDWFARG